MPQCAHGVRPNGRFVVVQLLERDVSLSGLVDAIRVEQLLYPNRQEQRPWSRDLARFIQSHHLLFADLGADEITEQFPTLAREFLELKLLDRSEVRCAGVDCNAGQQPFEL